MHELSEFSYLYGMEPELTDSLETFADQKSFGQPRHPFMPLT